MKNNKRLQKQGVYKNILFPIGDDLAQVDLQSSII